MSFKFNGGRGAIICDVCRIIIREDVHLKADEFHVCPKCMGLTYEEVLMKKGKKIADNWRITVDAHKNI